MSRRDEIRMTDEEAASFLAESHTLQVATINPDGTPHLVAMYYAVLDDQIAFWTYGKSQKVRNLQRDPRLTVMAESGGEYAELRGISITGTAVLSADTSDVIAVGEAIYPRYFGALGEVERLGVAHTARKRVAVRVQPERTVSWDHGKLGQLTVG